MKPLQKYNIPLKIQQSYLYVGFLLAPIYLLTYNLSAESIITTLILGTIQLHCVSIFYHRYLVHHAFKLNRWVNYIGTTFTCLYNGGSPYTWRSVHLLHHKFADTKLDPHSPERSSNIFKQMHYVSSNDMVHHKAKTTDLAWQKGTTDRYHVFLHTYGHYLKLAFSFFLLFIFGFEVMMIVHILPIMISTFDVACTNILAHSKIPFSHKPDNNTKNCAHNNFLVALTTSAGEGWHHNHHKYPERANFGEKWWQIDTGYYIIKLIEDK